MAKARKPNLMQVALTGLDQRDRTKEQLRQLLLRRGAAKPARGSQRGEASVAADAPPDTAEIEDVLTRLESSGLVSDRRFAEHFVRSARSRGASALKVKHKLGQRGVDRADIEQALETLSAEGQDDLAAAKSYTKRRRLTERYDLSDPKERQKALASLARQGFSMSTALRALGTNDQGDPEDR